MTAHLDSWHRKQGVCQICGETEDIGCQAWFCRPCNTKRQKESMARSRERKRLGLKPVRFEQDRTLKSLAARFTRFAIDRGFLPRLDGSIKCADCGEPAFCYDHRNYWRPVDVDPVCRNCNAQRGSAHNEFPSRLHLSKKAA